MKKNDQTKKYDEKDLIKAFYKAILKNIKNKHYKDDAQKVIRDILDPNYEAEVNPDEIPIKKPSVMNKAKKTKDKKNSLERSEKGIDKLKKFQLNKSEKRCGDSKK